MTISILVDRNNKIRHVLGMGVLIRKEINYGSFTTSLVCLIPVSSYMIDFRHIYNVANLTNV